MSNSPEIHAIWIGTKLGQMSRACLSSFVKHGHRVILHAYDTIVDLPPLIEVKDAEEIIPRTEIFRHREFNSYAPFSDLFRYELFAKYPGAIYVDCDVYCLKPFDFGGYIFGLQLPDQINSAVLALPAKSGLLRDLRKLRSTARKRWPWEPAVSFKQHYIDRFFAKPIKHEDKTWALTGPLAITYLAKKHNVFAMAKPMDWFYPVGFQSIEVLWNKDIQLEQLVTENTYCIHLFNEAIRLKNLSLVDPPLNSPIQLILKEGT